MRKIHLPIEINKLICFLILFSILSCKDNDSQKFKNNIEITDNIIIVLDLSDRILDIGQIERDRQIINYIYKKFVDLQRDKLYFNSNDKFRIIIASQNNQFVNTDLYSLEDSLFVDMSKIEIKEKKEVKKSIPDFSRKLELLYEAAKFSDKKSDYDGADILGFFKNSLSMNLINEKNCNNYIIVLTDGYQYVKGSNYKPIDIWEGVADLSYASALVLELNSGIKTNDNKISNMIEAWQIWLESMKIKKHMVLQKEAINKIENRIDYFFTNEVNSNKPSNESNKNVASGLEDVKVNKKSNPKISQQKLDELLNIIEYKLKETNKICEQSLYISLKSQVTAYNGINMNMEIYEKFLNDISNVKDLCK